MRGSMKRALVLGSVCATFVAARADDAGPAVVAAGDRFHGSLASGEHALLEVHLAKGDVFSFQVASTDRLLATVMIRDPNGALVNEFAHVRHFGFGKRVVAGPYRVPTSGSYAIEIADDSPNDGSYVGVSSVRARRSSTALPADGGVVSVEVSAGATIRLKAKSGLANLLMAAPGRPISTLAPADPMTVALRTRGVAVSQTGSYQFGATNAPGATISVERPRWKPLDVEALATTATAESLVGTGYGGAGLATAPVAVDAPTAGGAASLFVAGDVDAATNLASQFDDAGTTPLSSAAIPNETLLSIMPSQTCSAWLGKPIFGGPSWWRRSPWTALADGLPSFATTRSIPIATAIESADPVLGGGDDDPFVRRQFDLVTNEQFVDVTGATRTVAPLAVTTTTRFYVDGHQTPSLFLCGGTTAIRWTVAGSGTIGDDAWTLAGDWTSTTSGPRIEETACVTGGTERFTRGTLEETVSTKSLRLVAVLSMFMTRQNQPLNVGPGALVFDASGTVSDSLRWTDVGASEVFTRSYDPAVIDFSTAVPTFAKSYSSALRIGDPYGDVSAGSTQNDETLIYRPHCW